MSKKKAFALRIDEQILQALEKWSADEFRSVNGQIEWIIQKSLKDHKRMPTKPNLEEKNASNPDSESI